MNERRVERFAIVFSDELLFLSDELLKILPLSMAVIIHIFHIFHIVILDKFRGLTLALSLLQAGHGKEE